MVEEFGTDEDIPLELGVLDKLAVGEPWGLRPLLCGATASAFVELTFDLEGMAMFLRVGVDGLDDMVRFVGDMGCAGFILEGDGRALSMASYSWGMGTL